MLRLTFYKAFSDKMKPLNVALRIKLIIFMKSIFSYFHSIAILFSFEC